jgi:hypothetical protein
MHLILNLHDDDQLFFEKLVDAKDLDTIDFDLNKAKSLDLCYEKNKYVCIPLTHLCTEDKTETFYKYLYIVDTFQSLEDVCDRLANTNDLDVANYYINNQEFFDLFFNNDPYRAVYATVDNANYSTNDKFVEFDSNGNLESNNKIPYEDEANKIITRYFEEAEPEISWIAKLTATHSSGYTTTTETKGSSTIEIFEEDAYDALWEEFYNAYKEINDYDNPHEKALIKHIANSDIIDDTELPDWTIKINVYAT